MLTSINRRLSRRGLLKGAAVGAAAAFLAACQPKVVEVTRVVETEVEKIVEVEKAPAGLKEVNMVIAGWTDTAWQVSQRANAYNAKTEGVRVNIIPLPDGWTTKAMSEIQAGAPGWDGYASHHPFRISVQWLAQGLIQNIDDYLDVSPVLDIADFWADSIEPEKIKYDCSVKGKVVGVPMGIDTCCQTFRADLMEKSGLPSTREDFMRERSWDAIQDWAEKIKADNRADNVWGIVTWQVYHQSLGAIFQSITSDLYDADGLIKFDSEAMIRAFEIQGNWSWSGVAPTPAWGGDSFPKGVAGLWQGQVGVVGTSQRVWGTKDVPFAMPVLVEEGGTGGNQWYTTHAFVLNKSKHAQEIVDFYLDLFGPQNDQNAKLTLDFNWFPIFKSQWEKQIDPNPERHWAKDFLPQFIEADLVPRNPYYEIQVAASQKYCELCQAQRVTPQEAAEQCMAEVRQGVSELKLDW